MQFSPFDMSMTTYCTTRPQWITEKQITSCSPWNALLLEFMTCFMQSELTPSISWTNQLKYSSSFHHDIQLGASCVSKYKNIRTVQFQNHMGHDPGICRINRPTTESRWDGCHSNAKIARKAPPRSLHFLYLSLCSRKYSLVSWNHLPVLHSVK